MKWNGVKNGEDDSRSSLLLENSKKIQCNEPNVIKCDNTSDICFRTSSKCDGIADCPNGFDESTELCGELYVIVNHIMR